MYSREDIHLSYLRGQRSQWMGFKAPRNKRKRGESFNMQKKIIQSDVTETTFLVITDKYNAV